MPLLVIPQILAYHSIHLQFTHINSNGFGVYRVQIWYCEGIEEHVWANIGLQLLTLLAEKLPFEITYKTLFSVIVYTHTHTHTVPLVNVCGLRDQNLLFILLFWLPLIFIPEGLKSTQITHCLVSRLVEETFEINPITMNEGKLTLTLFMIFSRLGLQGFANYFIKLQLRWHSFCEFHLKVTCQEIAQKI